MNLVLARTVRCGRRNLNFKFRLHTVLKEAFNLSDGEEKFIVNAKVGEGTLTAQERRIPFYDFLCDEERRRLTTRSKQATA